jgi:hypothetical protein
MALSSKERERESKRVKKKEEIIMMTVTSLLLVFVHDTYIKVSIVSVSSLPSRCADPSGKRKRKNQVFYSVFFSRLSHSLF